MCAWNLYPNTPPFKSGENPHTQPYSAVMIGNQFYGALIRFFLSGSDYDPNP